MNANQKIACDWAVQMTSFGSQVISTSFFTPFNEKQAKEVAQFLHKKGIQILQASDKYLAAAILTKNNPNKLPIHAYQK